MVMAIPQRLMLARHFSGLSVSLVFRIQGEDGVMVLRLVANVKSSPKAGVSRRRRILSS